MGFRQRLRRASFFAAHPVCCFCGGSKPTEEIDHIPARHLFRNRQWPVGYEFPACSSCNDESAEDELIMGWLVRIQISDMNSHDEAEMEQCLRQLNMRHPSLVSGMKEMSRNETRRLLREQGLALSMFPAGEFYAIKMPEELLEVPKRYGEKLAKALFYMHAGRVFPSAGRIKIKALTNVEFLSPQFPLENFNVLTSKPAISRSGQSLESQFAYRYAVSAENNVAAFLIQFRESIVILALVSEVGELLGKSQK